MAIISALLSFVIKNLSSLVRAVLGWSVTALFGRLPNAKQTALSVAILVSLLWPVFVVGVFVPAVTAWAVAAAPIHKWIGDGWTRGIGIGLALLLPMVVGGISFWVAPPEKRKAGFWMMLLRGFPLSIGYAFSCLITAVTVPIIKLLSVLRRWEDEHVFVQPKEGEFDQALAALVSACERAGVKVNVRPVPRAMSLATNVVRWFAKGALESLVTEDPKVIEGKDVELYLYPADLLLRGKAETSARVRAHVTQSLLERHAFMVSDARAQDIQEEIQRLWDVLARHNSASEVGAAGRGRVRDIEAELDRTFLPFDQWVTLDRMLRRLELALGNDISERGEDEVMADIEKTEPGIGVPPEVPTGTLVREAFDEARTLIKLEVALAKKEVTEEIAEMKVAGMALGVAAVLGVVGVTMLAVTLVLAIAPTWACALVVAVAFLVLGAVAALIGWSKVPKTPMGRTKKRFDDDMKQLKEHIA